MLFPLAKNRLWLIFLVEMVGHCNNFTSKFILSFRDVGEIIQVCKTMDVRYVCIQRSVERAEAIHRILQVYPCVVGT